MSAKKRLLNYFLENVNVELDRDSLSDVAKIHDWQRVIRSLRSDDGWQIETTQNGYILKSDTPIISEKKRDPINQKLRYAVLHRDNSTCQRCGKTVNDGIKLHVDHKIPVDMGGKTVIDNLWTLCNECNLGKKNFFSDDESSIMKEISELSSGSKKLKRYFELCPNKVIEPTKLQIVSGGLRDWERALRKIRQDNCMDIQWVKPCSEFPMGGYIYKK